MRTIGAGIAATALLAACNFQPAANDASTDGGGAVAAPGRRRTIAGAAVATGRFFARDRSGGAHELLLKSFSVQATTHSGTVRSHVTMEVATSAAGQSEAVMRLAVPPGAAVTSAVLWIDGRPMNGVFVERRRATAIYESIVARRRDPALVTWDGPGWIAASIFPLEQNQARRFELDWVEPVAVAGDQVLYHVPTISEGDHLIGRAALQVDGHPLPDGGRGSIAIARADARPIVAGRAPGDPFQHVLARAIPSATAPRLVLVAETSLAMTPADRVRQRAAIEALLHELPAGARLTLLAADWDATPLVEDAGAATWPAALAKLDRIVSAGALDLERVLLVAAARARAAKADAVLFVGRGQDGFGGDALVEPLSALHDAHARLSMVAVGGDGVPPRVADAIARSGGEAVPARAFSAALPSLVDALRSCPLPPAVDGRGAAEWYALRTIAGQTVWLGRALEAPSPAVGPDGGAAAGPEADGLDLARLWRRARFEWPEREATAQAAPPDVLTPSTALLVLESEQDYARNGLPVPEPALGDDGRTAGAAAGDAPPGNETARRAAGPHGLFGLRPDTARAAAERAANAGILRKLEQSPDEHIAPIFGRDVALGPDAQSVLGDLVANEAGSVRPGAETGLTGTGRGGGGTGARTFGLEGFGVTGAGVGPSGNGAGYARGAGGIGPPHALAPDVFPGVAEVRGGLDKEIIRRIVRRHVNEAKACYEQQLGRWPGLRGRVVVRFSIDSATGAVDASMLESSTVANGPVERCIVEAVRRWEFPRPLGGGGVTVTLPFVLKPSSDEEFFPERAPLTDALAILAGRGSLVARLERISIRLALRPVSDAEVLAWTVGRRPPTFRADLLVARLLHVAGRDRDAVRVLSESAATTPAAIAAELRALGADADAREVLRLAKR